MNIKLDFRDIIVKVFKSGVILLLVIFKDNIILESFLRL